MKKFLVVCIVSMFLSAGNVIGQTNVFEGELRYRSIENYDQDVVNASFGMMYNGARNTTYIIKDNRVLSRDESTHLCILYEPDDKTVTLYSDLIGKGMRIDYTTYANLYMADGTKEGVKAPLDQNLSPSMYKFEKKTTNTLMMNHKTEYTVGRIENKTNAADYDIYSIPDIKVPDVLTRAQLRGVEISGLIAKYKMNLTNLVGDALKGVPDNIKKKVQKNASKIVGAKMRLDVMKAYVYYEIKEIKERVVNEEEFAIPSSVKIKDYKSPTDVFKLIDLYKEQHAYLLSHNMYPTQVATDVEYDINEEWDF